MRSTRWRGRRGGNSPCGSAAGTAARWSRSRTTARASQSRSGAASSSLSSAPRARVATAWACGSHRRSPGYTGATWMRCPAREGRCSGSHCRPAPGILRPDPHGSLAPMQKPLLLFLVCAGCHSPASIPERWDRPAVVFLGDSLTAGQGVGRRQNYPALVEERMRRAGFDFPVVNAGISGDSTDKGLARLDKILRYPVAVLLVELGVNDALIHHRSLDQIRSNLARIVVRGRAAKARVVLAGMKIPLSFPEDYRRGFAEGDPSLAREYDLPLVPFLLEGVGGDPRFNQ